MGAELLINLFRGIGPLVSAVPAHLGRTTSLAPTYKLHLGPLAPTQLIWNGKDHLKTRIPHYPALWYCHQQSWELCRIFREMA